MSLKRTGAPVGHTVMEEGTVLHMRYAAIPKNSRSPNIGALLINYLLCAEGQEMLWKHDGLDLHLFPGSQTKRELDIVCARPKARSSSARRNGWRLLRTMPKRKKSWKRFCANNRRQVIGRMDR